VLPSRCCRLAQTFSTGKGSGRVIGSPLLGGLDPRLKAGASNSYSHAPAFRLEASLNLETQDTRRRDSGVVWTSFMAAGVDSSDSGVTLALFCAWTLC